MKRVGVAALAAVVAALLLAGASSADPPALQLPDDITAAATSKDGATVSYRARAQDPNVVTCDGPGGGTAVGTLDVTATFPIGTTTVNCTATDTSGGLLASGSFHVTVVDEPPVVTVPGDMTVHTTETGGTAVTYAASASDAVDGPLTPTCSPASGSTFPIGSTTVTCTANDSANNTTSQSFTVTVVLDDTTPPVVTVPSDISVETENPSGAVVPFTASATDNIDGTLTPTCTPPSGTTFSVGTTQVTCTATDSHGNPGSASFNVTVTLVDHTLPTISVPADISVQTSNPGGTAVTYTVTATDNIDGALTPSCAPQSGATFPVGTTTVNCTVTDSHGNQASSSFHVTVTFVDQTPPTLSNVPANIQAEANSPGGSVVNFAAPTATDNVDGPIAAVNCAPASGSTFPLGTTTVTCSATDAHGNTGSASFTVRVVDTTPPRLIVPGDFNVYATTPDGLPTTDDAAIAVLTHYSVSDIADPNPTVTTDAPALLPVGATVVTFTARDASGNVAKASSSVTVRKQPPPGTTPAPLPPLGDIQAPDDVRSLTATAGDGVVTLTWKPPAAADFGSVVITRSPSAGGPSTVVYSGNATKFVDRGVVNGVEYRYVVVALDKSGNQSAGAAVVAKPQRSLLRTPADGARLRKAPRRLVWLPQPGASYYNVQLFRGDTKILSAWPAKAALALRRTWRYQGQRYRLTPGVYRWFVWPGLGARANADYGPMLGSNTFEIVR
jgi:HYR domain